MQATISSFHESDACAWCEKQTEGVTVEFDNGFLQKGPLCFKCLQQAIRVQHKQLSGQRQDHEKFGVK